MLRVEGKSGQRQEVDGWSQNAWPPNTKATNGNKIGENTPYKENRNSSNRITNIGGFVFIEAILEIVTLKPKCSFHLLTFIKRNSGCHCVKA